MHRILSQKRKSQKLQREKNLFHLKYIAIDWQQTSQQQWQNPEDSQIISSKCSKNPIFNLEFYPTNLSFKKWWNKGVLHKVRLTEYD